MLSLSYVSSSTSTEVSSDELLDILGKSRANNTLLGITGMLLYKDGNFMQVIEGPDEPIKDLFNKISRDPRHKGVIVLLKQKITQREFPDWSMGFRNLRDVDLNLTPGYRDFLNISLTSPAFEADPTRAQRLLLMFRKKM